jgi:hypothetical protein
LIVLAFLIGVVIVFTQATRGGDWQPIANLLAIGIAFVIGVEVISTLIIGGGGPPRHSTHSISKPMTLDVERDPDPRQQVAGGTGQHWPDSR